MSNSWGYLIAFVNDVIDYRVFCEYLECAHTHTHFANSATCITLGKISSLLSASVSSCDKWRQSSKH